MLMIYTLYQCLLRYTLRDNKEASREQAKLFDPNIMGLVMKAIYVHHRDKDTLYQLSPEAEEVYEEICEKYNDQFNLKWSGMDIQHCQIVIYNFEMYL